MAMTKHCCLVLWGAHCDEIAVAILVSKLRAAGLRVWLVGVSGSQIAGSHGLRIQPDLTPVEALSLVRWVICVVIPCDQNLLARFVNDPRVDELLTQAAHAQLQFVISSTFFEQRDDTPPYTLLKAMVYPQGVALFEFASTLVSLLTEG